MSECEHWVEQRDVDVQLLSALLQCIFNVPECDFLEERLVLLVKCAVESEFLKRDFWVRDICTLLRDIIIEHEYCPEAHDIKLAFEIAFT